MQTLYNIWIARTCLEGNTHRLADVGNRVHPRHSIDEYVCGFPFVPITYLSPPRIYLHHYKGITFKTYAVRLCPLMSAYDRVLTFGRVILTNQQPCSLEWRK